MSEIPQRTMFSVAYRVAQRMDRKNGRSAQTWTPEEAWDRLDSTERILWRDEFEKVRMEMAIEEIFRVEAMKTIKVEFGECDTCGSDDVAGNQKAG